MLFDVLFTYLDCNAVDELSILAEIQTLQPNEPIRWWNYLRQKANLKTIYHKRFPFIRGLKLKNK